MAPWRTGGVFGAVGCVRSSRGVRGLVPQCQASSAVGARRSGSGRRGTGRRRASSRRVSRATRAPLRGPGWGRLRHLMLRWRLFGPLAFFSSRSAATVDAGTRASRASRSRLWQGDGVASWLFARRSAAGPGGVDGRVALVLVLRCRCRRRSPHRAWREHGDGGAASR